MSLSQILEESTLKSKSRVIKRFFKHLVQRWTRGFDDTELWSLDHTVMMFVLPRLKAFKTLGNSYPPEFEGMEEWHTKIDEMIVEVEDYIDWDKDKKDLVEFKKYFSHLWD